MVNLSPNPTFFDNLLSCFDSVFKIIKGRYLVAECQISKCEPVLKCILVIALDYVKKCEKNI